MAGGAGEAGGGAGSDATTIAISVVVAVVVVLLASLVCMYGRCLASSGEERRAETEPDSEAGEANPAVAAAAVLPVPHPLHRVAVAQLRADPDAIAEAGDGPTVASDGASAGGDVGSVHTAVQLGDSIEYSSERSADRGEAVVTMAAINQMRAQGRGMVSGALPFMTGGVVPDSSFHLPGSVPSTTD